MIEPEHVTLKKGEVLFEEGDEAHTIYVVSEGEVEVVRHIESEERVIAHLGVGEFVGELSLLNREPRSATIRAKEDTILMEYDEDTFDELLDHNPGIARRLIQKLAKRLKDTNELLF